MQLICGINPVLEAFGAGNRHFDRLLVVKGLRNRRVSEAIACASQRGVPLRFEPRETLDRMAGGIPHQGIIAVVSPKPVIDLPALLQAARDPAFVVVLDGIEDPRNLGAILRTAEAAGADGVVLPERHTAALSETVSRASAGALEHVRVARVGNVSQAIEALKVRGLWVVGFDAAGTERWDTVDLCRPVAMVFGGEGRGIRRLVREHCDHLVSLPLFGQVSSLNVSVAAGIALYEVVRQRGTVPSRVRPIPLNAAAPVARIIGPPPEDTEHDPGLPQGEPHVAEAVDAEDGDTGPIQLATLDEDAWSGPTMVASGRQGWGRGKPWSRGEAAASKEGAHLPKANQPAPRPRDGRRRRRHGQRRPGGLGEAFGASSRGVPRAGVPPVMDAKTAHDGPSPTDAGELPAGQPGRRRRRRRTRR